MSRVMYSTEEVADALGLHVRTVRGYVRDGLLPAVRIGKQYRIAGDDLDAFTSRDAGPADGRNAVGGRNAAGGPAGALAPAAPARPGPPRAEVSAVVQVDAVDDTAMNRLVTLVMAAAGSPPGGDAPPLHVQNVYDRHRASLKIVLIGEPAAVAALLTLVSGFTSGYAEDGARP